MLRIVVSAMALLLAFDSNAIGKRSLDKFVKEKKELKDTLAKLRNTKPSEVAKSNQLTKQATDLIASVIKIDPTVASEFQDELDSYVMEEVSNLKTEAKTQTKELQEKEKKEFDAIEKEENKIQIGVEKVLQAEGEILSKESKEVLIQAANSGKLAYWAWVKTPISWAAYPFTALINKSWKLTMSIFNNFIKTASKFGLFKNKALKIIETERLALHKTIILTSLCGAKKVNAALERLNNNNDLTALAPKERGWFLGKVFKTNPNVERDKNSFRNTELYTWLVHEFLEAGAILSQDINLAEHDKDGQDLQDEVNKMAQLWNELSEKDSFNNNQSVQCLWYEIGNVLISAAKKQFELISQAEKDANAGNYPVGKLNDLLLNFNDIIKHSQSFITLSENERRMRLIDSRSFEEHLKLSYTQRMAQMAPSGETVAAIAGLALVFMGSSKLVEDYFPQYKTTISAYAAIPINMAINALSAGGNTLKSFATRVSSTIRQFPIGEKMLNKVESIWNKASGLVTAGTALVGAGLLKAKNKIVRVQQLVDDEERGETGKNDPQTLQLGIDFNPFQLEQVPTNEQVQKQEFVPHSGTGLFVSPDAN